MTSESQHVLTPVASTFWQKYLSAAQPTYLSALHAQDAWKTRGCRIHETQEVLILAGQISELTLLSIWASMLATHSLADDIVFGVGLKAALANESANTAILPLRVLLSGNDDPGEIVDKVKTSLQQIEPYTNSRLAEIQALDKSTQNACNFGSVITIRHDRLGQVGHEHINGHSNSEHQGGSESAVAALTPLSLVCEHTESSTKLTICLRSDVRLQCLAGELLHQFQQTLAEFSTPDQPNEHLPAPKLESSDCLTIWTRACEPVPSEQLLHAGVELQSRLQPLAVAIGETETVMMYQELNLGADLLAQMLLFENPSDMSTSPNVGVCFDKSAYAILSMLAILKAGKAYVPLDIDWPAQRIRHVMEDAQISVVLCSAKQADRFQNSSLMSIVVDEDLIWQMRKNSSLKSKIDNTPIRIKPTDTAYILYTSGSTGKPKGISISHRAITTSICAMGRFFDINTNTRTFQHTTFTFDLSVADIWTTLTHGGRLCMPSEMERLDPGAFIIQERCTYTMTTPSLASTVDAHIWSENLQTLSLIGEVVPERLLLDLASQRHSPAGASNGNSHAEFGFRNTWGPTEACVIACSSGNICLDDDGRLSPRTNCIGYPVGCSIFIVSATDPHHLAPAFAPGEIALVGHTLATCYYGNLDKTADAFRTDLKWSRDRHWADVIGDASAMERVYLTGDIARYSESGDGSVIFMRRKEQGYVKLNGYRIEPGEVESRIDESSNGTLSRRGTCVLVHEREMLAVAQGDSGVNEPSQTLVCFFVVGDKYAAPGQGAEIAVFDMKTRKAVKRVTASLRDILPEYMIPRLFVPLENMPTLTSHKIDKAYLRHMLDASTWQDLLEKFGF